MIKRLQDSLNIQNLLRVFPATAILGARQCGKTTMAREFGAKHYFDLESPRDLVKLENPQLTLEPLDGLIVIDEVQRKPELFPLLRVLIDEKPSRRFLILGSASRNLLQQSSESLAGRIGYYQLGGLRLTDVGIENMQRLWLQGAFPRAYTAATPDDAQLWLDNYISTFLEHDIPQLGIHIAANDLRRFWLMLSHYHGQIVNYAELATSFGVSDYTVKRYIDILCGTFMVRTLQPWHANISKRMVKKPKLYIRDSGILHRLLSIDSVDVLTSHPKLGASWEGFAIENVFRILNKRDDELYFWRTHTGSEVDLFWQEHGKNWAVEFKFSDAPRLTKSIHFAIQDLKLSHLWVIYPGKEEYRLAENVTVLPLTQMQEQWNYNL
jgi:uncharacterized protein